MSLIFNIKEHTIPASHTREFARATSLSQEEGLVQHVKQYIPRDNPNPKKGDISIVGAHANGFPKELYEPLWEELYRELKSRGLRIRSIYIADAAWQGQSGILNRSKLGNDPSWNDYARDITHMVNTLRPSRPLIGIGHSFGGATIVNVSVTNPRLFSSVVLLDPVISNFSSTPGGLATSPATMSIYRRDVWPSRAEATASFDRSPFYRSWDKRVLKLWDQYGIRPTDEESPDGEVTLATTKHQEVFTYLRPSWPAFDEQGKNLINPSAVPDMDTNLLNDPSGPGAVVPFPLYRAESPATLTRIPNVRPPVLYIFGRQSNLSPSDLIEQKLSTTGIGVGGSGGRAQGKVKGVVGEENGHLIPMEAPLFCAREAADWIKKDVDVWAAEEKDYESWTRKPQSEKSTISEDYKKHAGKPLRNGTKEKAKI